MGLSATARSAAFRKLSNSFWKKSAWARLKWARGLEGAASTARRAAVNPLARESGLKVESLPVVLDAQQRQHRPGIGIGRRLPHRQFQAGPRSGELLGGDPLQVAEAAQHGLVGAQLLGGAAAHGLAHAPGQNSVHVGDRRNDPRNQVVLQLEDRLRAEGAFVVLGPEMSAGDRVHELHREAQLRSRLPKASLHHVARAELLAGGTDVTADSARRGVELRAITLR